MERSKLLTTFDLTLYHMSFARSLRVKWLAAELGIIDKMKLEDVALQEGEQFQPQFKKMNKMSAVPTLMLTDKVSKETTYMTESAGICLFLTEHTESGEKYRPAASNILGQAAYYRMVTFASASMDPLLWSIRMYEVLLPEPQRNAAVAQMARDEFLNKVVPTLEEVLEAEEVEYLCEPYHKGFTTADVVVGYSCWWALQCGLLDGSPVLQGYLKRVTSREQFKRAREVVPADKSKL